MAFSSGQSFFQDLLHYSDEHANDGKELEVTFALQARAADFFKNNTFPILKKSQTFSGMNTNGKKEPLGGPINMNVSGTNNLPGTGICGPEFDFWGKSTGPAKKEIIQEQNNIIEEYTNVDTEPINNFHMKEHFTENFNGWDFSLVVSILIILLIVGTLIYMISKYIKTQ